MDGLNLSQPTQTAMGGQAFTGLNEQMFQEWYKNWATLQGWPEDPDDPNNDYDYRGFFKSPLMTQYPQVDPTDNNTLHWPSEFKKEGHPREFVPQDNGLYLNTKTGVESSVPSLGLNLAPYFQRGQQ